MSENQLPPGQLPTERQAIIHRERATRMVEEGRIADAIKELAEAVRQDGREAGSWQLLGEIYGAAGYHEPAASYIQRCLQEDHTNIAAWVALANIYSQIGGPYLDLALDQIDTATSFDPENPDLFYMKGNVYAQQGQADRARDAYKKALEIKPGHPYAKHDLEALGAS